MHSRKPRAEVRILLWEGHEGYFDIQGRSMPWFQVGGTERKESKIAGRRQLQKGLKIKSEEVQNENAETGLYEKLTYFQRL